MKYTEKLSLLPDQPGVYQMKDQAGEVIYVGKARSLRQRVRSYFANNKGDSAKVRAMVAKIADFEYIITDTEREALVLESNLIKELRPHYNIRIKDDKHYPYLRLAVREDYPTLAIVRRVRKDGARYFGPYPNGGAVREMLKRLKRVFPLRQCNREIVFGVSGGRPCLNFHLKQCLGPCQGNVTASEYAAVVRQVEMLLDGRHDALLGELRREMKSASDQLHFEKAGRIRDQVLAVEAVVEKQKFDAARVEDRDILGMARGLEEACVAVFRVREGKVVGRDTVFLSGTSDQSRGDVLRAFLVQFYNTDRIIPREIAIAEDVEGTEELSADLSSLRGKKVKIIVPKRGEKKQLADLAARNAQNSLEERWMRTAGKQELVKRGLEEMKHYLQLNELPSRMECYDISNIAGTYTVGSMVVFLDGSPSRGDYRRFRIKWVEGANDFASMHEVLVRRLTALREARQGFASTPDLIIVDGGKGQLSSAADALRQEGYAHLSLVALAKAEELVFLPGEKDPVVLPRDSQARYMMQRIRDEAHRFAISYHRGLRAKGATGSVLEQCPGIGAARRKSLLRHFGSLSRLREASAEELASVKGMNFKLAMELRAFLDTV